MYLCVYVYVCVNYSMHGKGPAWTSSAHSPVVDEDSGEVQGSASGGFWLGAESMISRLRASRTPRAELNWLWFYILQQRQTGFEEMGHNTEGKERSPSPKTNSSTGTDDFATAEAQTYDWAIPVVTLHTSAWGRTPLTGYVASLVHGNEYSF